MMEWDSAAREACNLRLPPALRAPAQDAAVSRGTSTTAPHPSWASKTSTSLIGAFSTQALAIKAAEIVAANQS